VHKKNVYAMHLSLATLLPLSVQMSAGALVTLQPLQEEHLPALLEIGTDPAIWANYPLDLSDPTRHLAFLREMLAQVAAGTCLAFVICWGQWQQVVGLTRLYQYQVAHRQAEVGSWLAPAFWKSGVNRISKLLLLQIAFEQLGLLRVQFRTDVRNRQSQTALEKMGARKEGILRKERILEDGTTRDAVLYSILDEEWPEIKSGLMEKIRQADIIRRGGVPASFPFTFATPERGWPTAA
jgi:N-acetyltransferase